ncbi:MAG: phospholipase D-like domain-containing protein, partial [bacterium]|nr:phospholipase D-like domain-containing protein [bacterium]
MTFENPQFFFNGESLFPALEKMINESQEEIMVSVYTFKNDSVGEYFINALGAAAKRGVRVRVLFDELGSRHKVKTVLDTLHHAGVEAKAFRPLEGWLLRHPLATLCRNHTRLVIIDKTLFGLGGMSIARIYEKREDIFMLHRSGIIVEQARLYYEKLWNLASRISPPDPLIGPNINHSSLGYTLLKSGPEKINQEIYHWLNRACKSATNRITIATPFFFPDHELQRALVGAIMRGI